MFLRFLRRLWHWFYGAYAAVAFAIVILPTCLLIIAGPTLAARRAVGRFGVRLAMAASGNPIRVKGGQHLPPGPCVCVANHASYLDGLVLTAALPPRYSFLVQHGAAGWPLIGKTIERMGVSFVNRGSAREAAAATRELLRRLQEGESFAIFAEGTFQAAPGLLPFHDGAFAIAARAGVPVLPAVIRGTRTVFPEGARLPRQCRVEVELLPVIAPDINGRAGAGALREKVRQAILARCGEPDTQALPTT